MLVYLFLSDIIYLIVSSMEEMNFPLSQKQHFTTIDIILKK